MAEDCRIRHRHLRIKNRIIQFSIQLEIFFGNEWSPVVRYDTAHGVAHKDLIHGDGRVDKIPIFSLDYTDTLTFAEADLISNWHLYRNMFLEEATKND